MNSIVENITKGKWEIIDIDISNFKQLSVVSKESNTVLAHLYLPEYLITDETNSNAQLIADAGTTANVSGKLPSELLDDNVKLCLDNGKLMELNNELLEALREFINTSPSPYTIEKSKNKFKRLIKKSIL